MTNLIKFCRLNLLVVAIFTPFFGQAINLSKVEFSYLYKDSPAKFRYQIAKKDDTYRLVAYVELRKITDKDTVQDFTLLAQKKFTSAKEDLIEPLTTHTSRVGNTDMYDMTFQVNPGNEYLVVRFTFLTKPYIFDIPIQQAQAFPAPDFAMKPSDPLSSVYKMSDTLSFDPVGRGGKKCYAYLYKDDFSHSLPPFSDDIPDSDKRFMIASIEPFQTEYILPKENYLYYFQTDTSSKKGFSVYSYRDYFPNTKAVDELIGPLVYMATEKENKKLIEARDKKKAFDDFWLSLIPSKKLAARTIRNYFRRVKRANILFANYKAGWKTDKGMIYIMYGAPDQVFKREDQEIWEYEGYSGRIKFSFTKVPNLFTQFHYSLDRAKNYTSVWFSQVEKWRKGDS